MRHIHKPLGWMVLLGLCWSASASAQATVLTVLGSDSIPIPFAWVSVRGGIASITDDHGNLNLGRSRNTTLAVEIRRIGYAPWTGKLDLADTATKQTVVLRRLPQALGAVTITGRAASHDAALAGFYDRWLMRQKGALSATFIGPEEIDKRHVSRPSDLLDGVNGVYLMRSDRGGVFARGIGGTCFMSVLLDGRPLCPTVGCHASGEASNAPQLVKQPTDPGAAMAPTLDDLAVNLNQYINADDIVAIEVYSRGANMPSTLQAPDNACGVIAIWTGTRR